jgi:hypothetical protein
MVWCLERFVLSCGHSLSAYFDSLTFWLNRGDQFRFHRAVASAEQLARVSMGDIRVEEAGATRQLGPQVEWDDTARPPLRKIGSRPPVS